MVLIFQPFHFLAQAAENAGFGQKHGIDRHPQLLGNCRSPGLLQSQALESPPGGRIKIPFHQLQDSTGQVMVMFLVPAPTEETGRVFELIQNL